MTIHRQCELLSLSRSGFYYIPVEENRFNLKIMRRIDEQYTRTPFYGVRRMTQWLIEQGYAVNRKRVRRLMRLMALEAVYPKPRLSLASEENLKYPYLLRGLVIDRPNQVWSADITYIRLGSGLPSSTGSAGMFSPVSCFFDI